MRRFLDGNVYVVEIDDSLEVDTFKLERTNSRNKALSVEYDRDGDSSPEWRGGTRHEVETILRDGWPEGLAIVSDLSEELSATLPPPKSYRRKGQWRDDGDEPSWEREQQGHESIWRTSRREVATGPTTVQLVCPWVHSAMRKADEIKWNGVVLAVLVNLLETAGYRCGAMLANTVGLDGGGFLFGMLHVKRPENPLDLASLVPLVAHPAPYRWHGIAWATLAQSYCGYGHGRVIRFADLPDIHDKPKNAVVLNTVYTASAAKAEILRVLALFGSGHPTSEQGTLL
jgi:hypothetical protein